jgi:hypothetical protein
MGLRSTAHSPDMLDSLNRHGGILLEQLATGK